VESWDFDSPARRALRLRPTVAGGMLFRGVRMTATLRVPLTLCVLLIPASLSADWPFFADGPMRGSPEYYQAHACQPIGERQKCKFGKVWPPEPRPTGEHAPLIHQYYANFYWPYPYQCADRQSVYQYQNIQIANGWQDATTLYDYHFDPVSNELNSSGRDHLYWILASAPMEYRTTFVQTSRVDPRISNLRLASVQGEASRFVGAEQVPPVMLRVATPHGTPAAEVMSVFDYRRTNLNPPPMVQYTSGATGGGSESGG
jgi:hypothetical protein